MMEPSLLEERTTARPSTLSAGDLYSNPKKRKIAGSSKNVSSGEGVNPCSFSENPRFKACPRITTLNPLLPVK